MKSGKWLEDSAERFLSLMQKMPGDLFNTENAKRLRETVDLQTVESMLGIGCGDGRRELALLEHFPITADLIEPSDYLHAQLLNNVKSHKGPGRADAIFHGAFEEFQTDKRYDLIYANHSFYYLKDPVRSVQTCLSLLKPGGHLVIVMHVANSFSRRLIDELDHAGIHGEWTAERLRQAISIPSELSFIETSLSYQAYVEGDGLSTFAKTQAAFLAFRDFKTLSTAELKRVREIADECSDGQVIKGKFGQIYIRAPL